MGAFLSQPTMCGVISSIIVIIQKDGLLDSSRRLWGLLGRRFGGWRRCLGCFCFRSKVQVIINLEGVELIFVIRNITCRSFQAGKYLRCHSICKLLPSRLAEFDKVKKTLLKLLQHHRLCRRCLEACMIKTHRQGCLHASMCFEVSEPMLVIGCLRALSAHVAAIHIMSFLAT